MAVDAWERAPKEAAPSTGDDGAQQTLATKATKHRCSGDVDSCVPNTKDRISASCAGDADSCVRTRTSDEHQHWQQQCRTRRIAWQSSRATGRGPA
eukprot:346145-Rhodomonas_salina.1